MTRAVTRDEILDFVTYEERREAIREAVRKAVSAYRRGDGYEVPMPAVVAAAVKP